MAAAAAAQGLRNAAVDFERLYEALSPEMTPFDCGAFCAAHNPNGIPFCCDICQAVPAAYLLEWDWLQGRTDQWHEYRGDECASEPVDPAALLAQTPEHMLLLACKGPAACRRDVRALSCRQFPFYPYINSRGEFLGLAYEWQFEETCWVISHLDAVTAAYRNGFAQAYEALFAAWDHDLESYAAFSEEAREVFAARNRLMPLLHRDGGYYLLNPREEHLQRVSPVAFERFGPYRIS